MFLVSLNRELRQKKWFSNNKYVEPDLINYLDLVTLGTVCDVVPLTGLNRAIVKQGLKIIRSKKKSRNPKRNLHCARHFQQGGEILH